MAPVTSSVALVPSSVLVPSSKALVTRSDALVSNSFLLLVAWHLLLVAWHLFLVAFLFLVAISGSVVFWADLAPNSNGLPPNSKSDGSHEHARLPFFHFPGTSATLVVIGALLVVTMFADRINLNSKHCY